MKSRPSISRFELCLLLGASAALWWGCAAAGSAQRGIPADNPPSGAPAPGTRLELSYGNASARARVEIDLSSTDIDLRMSSRPPRDTAKAAAPAAPLQAAPLPGTAPSPAPAAVSAPSPAPPANTPPDTVTTAVVSGIRLAQDLFYRKQYPEALAAVQRTIDRKPTAEAHALAGSIHYVLGDRQRAGTSWREALRMNPDLPGAAQMLARLDEEGPDAVRRPAASTTPGGRP